MENTNKKTKDKIKEFKTLVEQIAYIQGVQDGMEKARKIFMDRIDNLESQKK